MCPPTPLSVPSSEVSNPMVDPELPGSVPALAKWSMYVPTPLPPILLAGIVAETYNSSGYSLVISDMDGGAEWLEP